MERVHLLARIVAYLLLIVCALHVIQHAVELASKDLYKPDDPSTEWVKEIHAMPGLFWILLLVEVSRLIVGIILTYSVHYEKYFIVYVWILLMTVYVMLLFVIMPLVFAWYRYLTLPLNLIVAWITFPFYCFSIYIMMLFYVEIQE